MKRITRGSLNDAILPRQCSISSSSVASRAGQQLDERRRHLEQPLVRDADDLDEADRRVQRELGLDLLRRDVLAADLQRLLDAAEEEHAAVLVHHAEVAHRHPAAGEDRLGGLHRVVPVAVERAEAAEVDHAALARGRARWPSSTSTIRSSSPGWQAPQVFRRTSSGSSSAPSVTDAALGPAVDRQLDRVRESLVGSARAPRAGRRWRTSASRSGRRSGSPGGRRSPPSPAGRRDRTR